MEARRKIWRLASFFLLSAGVVAIVSCQSQQQGQTSTLDVSPAVVSERSSGDIGQRLRGPDRTDKTAAGYVKYD